MADHQKRTVVLAASLAASCLCAWILVVSLVDGPEDSHGPAPNASALGDAGSGPRSSPERRGPNTDAAESEGDSLETPARSIHGSPDETANLISVNASLAKARFPALEDVTVEVTVQNRSSERLEFPDVQDESHWQFVGAELVYEGWQRGLFKPGYRSGPFRTRVLGPGEALKATLRLQDVFPLTCPGRYTVRACFDPDRMWGESPHALWTEPIEFVVEPPTDARLRDLIASIDPDTPWRDMNIRAIAALGDFGDPRAIPLLETIVARAKYEDEQARARGEEGNAFGYTAPCVALVSLDKIEVAAMLRADDLEGLKAFVKRNTRGSPRQARYQDEVKKLIDARWGAKDR